MRILRVNMGQLKTTFESLPEEWNLVGGRGLIARIMNREVPPDVDPLGEKNKLIIAGGPLAGTNAPQLGRISVGGKSPLTLGIKEANAGGPAAQKLDRLDIRAIVVEGAPAEGRLYLLKISKDGATLLPADEYRGLKNYPLTKALYDRYAGKPTVISIGIAGERKYRSASVALTDMLGDPSRNAARGGLGAVMGAKGLKAIVIDDSGAPPVEIARKDVFRETVKSWVDTLAHDSACGFFNKLGTPYAVAFTALQGTMPGNNYTTGRPEGFRQVTGEVIKRKGWERGGRMHGCMPGCVVQCSIIYNDASGKHLASAYEYEGVGILGTNLGIADTDAIGRLTFACDDLGIDFIEVGSAMGVAASAGRMKFGDVEAAVGLLAEIEKGTEFGSVLADGVAATAKSLNISRVPAYKGQAIPAHDPRAAKGIGVTYATSPMGADHTAGLTYRNPLQKNGQVANSLRSQIQNATCDTIGYCINSVPGGQSSVYSFFADLLNARYGLGLTGDDVLEIGKQTLKDELKFNQGAEFSKHERCPAYVRTEALPPTNHVFDVEEAELDAFWSGLDAFKEAKKVWEVRLPTLPPMLFGAGVIARLGERVRTLNTARVFSMKKAMLVADPTMKRIGLTAQVQDILAQAGVATLVFSEVEPDPPVEEIEKAGALYRESGCDSVVGVGGGSTLDAAKAIALRVSHPGILIEYEGIQGGSGKIRPPLPPVICIPTTSGTGSEANQYAVITDRQRGMKFIITSDLLIPRLAVVDPDLCRTCPPGLTAETGVDALGHCVEGYVGLGTPYHPYYEALALYGVKLVGKSLRAAYRDGNDIGARTDLCMAAIYGGVSFTKGLGIGHGIGHAIGERFHVSHGRAVAAGLLCFVRANRETCREQFADLAYALDRTNDLEAALVRLYQDLKVPVRLRDLGITEEGLGEIAFETAKDVVNMAGNPTSMNQAQVLKVLKEFY